MDRTAALELTLLAGARTLLGAHARELPQRDDLCGAFCGALALEAARIGVDGGDEQLDQDAVAHAAGTVVSRVPDLAALPNGERGRRDYRIAPVLIDDASASGTNCVGVVRALERLSGGRVAAIPLQGPWSVATLDGLFELVATFERPVSLIANVATRELWGSHARVDVLLDYLLAGAADGPPPDWDVGHFVCVAARASGPGGNLYVVLDTYPSLGRGGIHLQPREQLARALARPGMAPGGMIAVVAGEDAAATRAGAARLGLLERVWDNGTPVREPAR
ncbi:MAG TPA: hypothetical protein VK707_05895 [Solirubrobacteraceae bacterium]|jgi:hypothetical protein|nr:hypothetical protein [Solirubrobacteraceae bacterium]